MTTPLEEYKTLVGQYEHRINEALAGKMDRAEFEKWLVAIKESQEAVQEWRRSTLARVSDRGRIEVTVGRFGGLTALELALVGKIIERRVEKGIAKPDRLGELAEARKNLRAAYSPQMLESWEERSLKQADIMYGGRLHTPGGQNFKDSLRGWRLDMLTQVRKAMDSTTAGAGDELVPTGEAAELWMDINLESLVLPLLPQTQMPTNPFDWPSQLGDTNWYPGSENVALTTTTDLATKKATLTAYILKTGVPYSDELEEDSIIAWAPELRAQLAMNARMVVDDILLNADTTSGTNNINYDGGNLTTSTAGYAQYLIGFDGLVHLPMVDNTGQRSVQTSTLSNANYNNVLLKLGKYAAGGNRSDVVFIVPVNVGLKTLTLSQVETMEKYGPRATISTGEIASIYGRPLIMTDKLNLTAATGEVSATAANNTKGRILAFNVKQWRVGWKRGPMFEPDREPGKNQTTLYVSMRIALTERTGTRSTATHTAMVYDISSVT